jgi:hypothetical protein
LPIALWHCDFSWNNLSPLAWLGSSLHLSL